MYIAAVQSRGFSSRKNKIRLLVHAGIRFFVVPQNYFSITCKLEYRNPGLSALRDPTHPILCIQQQRFTRREETLSGRKKSCPLKPESWSAETGNGFEPIRAMHIFAAVLTVVSQRFSEDTVILAGLVHLKEQPTSMEPEPTMDYIRRVVWGMMYQYADNACIDSRSSRELAKTLEVIVEVCRTFALTMPEKKTETFCMPPPRAPRTLKRVEATVQIYKQV